MVHANLTFVSSTSSSRAVNWIANVEPIELFLDNLQGAWAERAVRTGNPHIQAFLDAPPAPGHHNWDEGRFPRPTLDSPICTSFHISGAHKEQLSYGDANDLRVGRCTDLSISDPAQGDSNSAALWAPHLESLGDRGWRIAYTDGSGAEGIHAAGVYSEGPCGTKDRSYGSFLGQDASVADAERMAMVCALEREPGMLVIASDSQAAISTVHRLCKGGPPRSGIEVRMKDLLMNQDREVGVLWVRSHMNIPGNEKADRRAALEGIQGTRRGDQPVCTPERLRARRKAIRKEARTEPGHGSRRTEWGKHSLSAYTWTRTNKGPQKSWLHHIGKAEDPSCSCGHPTQDGDHVVFHCPLTGPQRARLLPPPWKFQNLNALFYTVENM